MNESKQGTIKTILVWLKARNAGPALLLSADAPDGEIIELTVEHLPDGEVSGFPTRRRGCRAPAISANEEDSA